MLDTDTYDLWNVHLLSGKGQDLADKIERMLNNHADKGYKLHNLYAWPVKEGQQMRLVFVQRFDTSSDLEVYIKSRESLRATRPKA